MVEADGIFQAETAYTRAWKLGREYVQGIMLWCGVQALSRFSGTYGGVLNKAGPASKGVGLRMGFATYWDLR